ncbi:SWIM zinc finger family protein [Streptomyces sp. NPDC085937]|uniref:SWIM zinc finger family protein n=1 Tax=Streptomyces sp. NPDC085937 TaxID=3365742 RepID=UPI0037D58C43
MTPRPSEEAREALRAARARVSEGETSEDAWRGEPRGGPSAGEEPSPVREASPAPQAPRPSDAAREALHRALRARRGATGEPQPGVGPGPESDVEASAEVAAEPRPISDAVAGEAAGDAHPYTDTTVTDVIEATAAEGESPAEGGTPAGEGPNAGETPAPAPAPVPEDSADSAHEADATAPATGDGAEPSAHRPGDVAREALRAAREEAARARAREQVDEAKRTRRASAPAPRVPRTTRGDRAADRRAREIRETLADAFRMPDTADDPAPDAPAGVPGRGPDARPTAREDTAPGTARGTGITGEPAAVPPVAPSSMAAPARDGDLRRSFPPFPPRSSDGAEQFAETWWGRAWVTALEDGALDPARLARGRGYAEQGHVDAITVTPGLVLAYVRGSRARPYRVQVRLRTFDDADWERFLDAAAERPGHIAALLDKEMPQSLADCGVPLLPGPGDLAPRCSCPDSGHPCKHAAALCYQTARLLDADPFVLLLLRGRSERQVIDVLSRLSAARAARAAQGKEPEPLPGIRATDALARRGTELPPPPAPLPPPPHPEQPPVYPASPGGPDPFALDQLATDAAARAHALLTTGRDPVGPLTLWHDAVRLAAARPGSGLTAGTRALYSSFARAAGRTPGDLARAVAAWRQGGPTGLAVLEEPWDPPAGRFDRARPLLLAADLPAFRPWRNRLTHPRGHVQLRLGRDHLWYAYESEPDQDDWWPRGTPDPDPVGALTGLDTLGDL